MKKNIKPIKTQILQSAAVSFLCAIFFLTIILLCTPKFTAPYSFIIYGTDGALLGASAAADGQWRFPKKNKIPKNYKEALLTYEDKNFYFHFGIDPLSVLRAFLDNVSNKKIVSGASTITMQTARLSEKNTSRTFTQKLKEAVQSLMLELKYSKTAILNLYASHAPYGGNVVGIEAAAWRYFGRNADSLTWAEASVLAVLPNQPSLVHPGKQSLLLEKKRNRLLLNLFVKEKISEELYLLSIAEPVPEKPKPQPQNTMHYLELLKAENKDGVKNNITHINSELQNYIYKIAERYFNKFSLNGIYNIAVLVQKTDTGEIVSYIANTGLQSEKGKNAHVDMIQARRSSGSLLKPLLFAGLLDAGMILPEQLLIDIPTKIAGYNPQNSTYKYTGAVPAKKALAYSLNVPFVRATRDFTVPAFLDLLKRCGFTTFNRTAEEYGLPIILGGGEITLFEITGIYRKMMLQSQNKLKAPFPLSPAACRITLDALADSNRPEEEAVWYLYADRRKIAWKTGTSYGNKDAWTIGVTPEYTVGIWCGNASGEGRPEITSTKTAAPILFEVFGILPKTSWPVLNKLDFEFIEVCADSGHSASKFCNKTKKILKPAKSHPQSMCPYCRAVSLTQDGRFQAQAGDVSELPKIESRFILPAAAEYFYRQNHPEYKPLPKWIKGSAGNSKDEFELLFPEDGINVFIPTELDGSRGAMIAEAAHKDPSVSIYWDIDGEYLGMTQVYHQMKIQVEKGAHILTLTDNRGKQIRRIFTVIGKE